MADEKPTSWWATLPGLLTAAAAVITAVTGLLLGLGQLGLFDAGRPAASTASASSTTAGAAQPDSTVRPTGVPSATGDGAGWTVALPAERKFRAGDVEYEIFGAGVRPDVSGQVALTVALRCTNHGRYDINFWDSTFRLNADGISYSPDSGLNELVAGDSSKSGDVRFILPAHTREALLRIKFVQGESTAQLAISPP